MATETRQKGSDSPSLAGIVPYRLSARQFRKMLDAGIFPERVNVELVDGLPTVKDADKPVPTFDGVPLYRLSVKQVYQMVDAFVNIRRTNARPRQDRSPIDSRLQSCRSPDIAANAGNVPQQAIFHHHAH